MEKFGFSSYLKLLSLSPKQQRAEIRKRLLKAGKPYDFHRSMRLHANRMLIKGETVESVLASVRKIARDSERRSALEGLSKLLDWKDGLERDFVACEAVLYDSPRGRFSVTFRPDVGYLNGGKVAVHLWNTARPSLDLRALYGALGLVMPLYGSKSSVSDLLVLSLRNGQAYKFSDAGSEAAIIGARMASAVDDIIDETAEEIRRSGIAGIAEHPSLVIR